MRNVITPKDGWTGNEIKKPVSGVHICPNCRAEYRPGFTTCSDCNVALVTELPSSALDVDESSDAEQSSPSPLNGRKCSQHSMIDAVALCRSCSSGVCSTCDFQISGLHFCPKCVDNANDEKIDPRQKKLAIGAITAAIYCTLSAIFTLSGALYRAMGGAGNEHAVGLIVMWGLYIPSVIGTVLGFSAFERRQNNPLMIWTGLIWNTALMATFLVVEIAAHVR